MNKCRPDRVSKTNPISVQNMEQTLVSTCPGVTPREIPLFLILTSFNPERQELHSFGVTVQSPVLTELVVGEGG